MHVGSSFADPVNKPDGERVKRQLGIRQGRE